MPEQYLSQHPGVRRLLKLLPVAMAVTVMSFALAGYTLLNRSDEAAKARERVCRVAKGDRTVLRNLLLLAQATSRTSLKENPKQLARAQAYYKQALALIKPVDCTTL